MSQVDINKYRNANETEKEWQLKRLFIEKYKEKFDEDRLICLAQCFTNIETMGCRYSNEIMNQIKSLTADFEPLVKERLVEMNKEMRNHNQKNPPKQQQQPKFNNNKNYKQPQQQHQKPEQLSEQQQPSKQKLISKSQLQNNIDQPQIQILSRNKPNETKPTTTPSKTQPQEQPNKSANNNNNQTPHKDLASLFKQSSKTNTPDSNSNLSSKNRANFSNNSTTNNLNKSSPANGLGSNNNNSASSNNVLLGILKNSSFTSITTPVVPVGTSEQSPAPSQLPIPFGLSPSTKNSARRNVLLDKLGVTTTTTSTPPNACSFNNALNNSDYLNSMNSLPVNLFSEPEKTKDPLSVLFPNSSQTLTASSLEQNLFKLSAENSEFDNFNKLNKINKLRNALRVDKDAGKHIFDDNYDIIDYFKKACADNNVKLDYVQYSQPENVGFYGELLLESFRLLSESNKKRKKCSYYAHKNALDLLCSSSELAVKVAPKQKRDASMKLDDENAGAQMVFSDLFKANKKYENSGVEFEYELYRVDSNEGTNQLMSDVPCTSAPKSKIIDSSLLSGSSFSMPAVVDTSKTEVSLQDLNALLKSMILKPQNIVPNNNNNHLEGSCINASTNDDSKESQINDNENEDEDDDDNKSQGMDKKTKIKQNLENFCLYVSAQGPNEVLELHERNSLQILTTSCNKSNCNLEFELKHKSSNNKSTKTIISGDRIQSESDDELNGDAKQKYKCKCLINGVKIASAHSKVKTEAKRAAALKAIKYLHNLFPTIKETSYQNQIKNAQQNPQTQESTSSSNATAKYVKISKEDLFRGLIPPTLFEASLSQGSLLNSNQRATNQPQLGEKLLKKMGWKGEGFGLGRKQQGMLKPIEMNLCANRCRLGLGFMFGFGDGYDEELQKMDQESEEIHIEKLEINDRSNTRYKPVKLPSKQSMTKIGFINNIVLLLSNFISSQTDEDLVFDHYLTIEDRKIVHREAQRLGLKSKSEGSGANRFLVVKKKRSNAEILESMLKNGGQASKYQLISYGDLK